MYLQGINAPHECSFCVRVVIGVVVVVVVVVMAVVVVIIDGGDSYPTRKLHLRES